MGAAVSGGLRRVDALGATASWCTHLNGQLVPGRVSTGCSKEKQGFISS